MVVIVEYRKAEDKHCFGSVVLEHFLPIIYHAETINFELLRSTIFWGDSLASGLRNTYVLMLYIFIKSSNDRQLMFDIIIKTKLFTFDLFGKVRVREFSI